MKRNIILIFIIIFSFKLFADEINDFQISGISLGDNLLDFYSQDELDSAYTYKYKDDVYRYYVLDDKQSNTYDYIQITIKSPNKFISSKELQIYSISGVIEYTYNIEECYPKQKIIKEDLDQFFKIEGILNSGKHPMDESNNSTWNRYEYYIGNDYYPLVRITCYDMSDEIEKQGFTDQLHVIVSSFEFVDFVTNKQWE